MMRGRCEDCSHFDGTYCCSGFIEDEDVTIKEIGKRVREAEEKGGYVDWSPSDCPSFEPNYDDSFEDVAFDNWRERYEE